MMRRTVSVFALLVACSAFAPIASALPVTFSALYNDGAGEGFNDATLGPTRKSAFEFALNQIGGLFDRRYAGETVVVRAQFDPLGGTTTSATLGSAGPSSLFSGIANAPVAGVYYPTALANHRQATGVDINGSTYEIDSTFNSDVDNATVLGSTNWYYGTNSIPGSNVDFVTVALHELGHGLGFTGFLQSSGAYAFGAVSIYDNFMNTSSSGGTKLTALGSDAARAAEATGNDLYWDGAVTSFNNGGARPKLYAPASFSGGSSLYHLDETSLPNELLSPFYSGADHSYSPIERGMLSDMGWTLVYVPEAGALAFGGVASGLACFAVAAKRQRKNEKSVRLAASP